MHGKFEGKVQFLKAKMIHADPPTKFHLSHSLWKYMAIDDKHMKSVVFSAFLKSIRLQKKSRPGEQTRRAIQTRKAIYPFVLSV